MYTHIFLPIESFLQPHIKFKNNDTNNVKAKTLLHWNIIIMADIQIKELGLDRCILTSNPVELVYIWQRHRIPLSWFGESLLAFLFFLKTTSFITSTYPCDVQALVCNNRSDCVYFLHSFGALRSETIDGVFNILPMFYEACSKHGPLHRPLTIPTGED